jgi:hypothetical protein
MHSLKLFIRGEEDDNSFRDEANYFFYNRNAFGNQSCTLFEGKAKRFLRIIYGRSYDKGF